MGPVASNQDGSSHGSSPVLPAFPPAPGPPWFSEHGETVNSDTRSLLVIHFKYRSAVPPFFKTWEDCFKWVPRDKAETPS